MYKIVIFSFIFSALVSAEINFDALKTKKGTHSSMSVDFSDAVKASDRQWQKKKAENEARAAYYKRLHKNRPVQQTQILQVPKKSRSPSNNLYVCTFTCKGLGMDTSVQVYAKSNHRAQLKSEKMASRYCRKTLHTTVLNKWGSGETKCTKQ